MRKILSVLCMAIVLLSCTAKKKSFTTSEVNIIPKPTSLVLNDGVFEFTRNTTITISDDFQNKGAKYLADLFKKSAGYLYTVSKANDVETGVVFKTKSGLAAESYELNITSDKVEVLAGDDAGAFYAVQTIRQLLPVAIEAVDTKTDWLVPTLAITDTPRTGWRGMHTDFSRHFYTKEEVYDFLDNMALYKLNLYHMHLTDDQGWRIEIKKYPKLTDSINVYREHTKHDLACMEKAKDNELFEIDPQHYKVINGKKLYGGYYTQEDIKDIVKYAGDRCIDILPEIDMPGHFKGALDAYPEMTCFNKSGQSRSNANRSIPLCPSKEIVYEFIDGMVEELVELFPFEFIHVGSDEVNFETWEAYEGTQRLIKEEGLNGVHELQAYFNRRAEKIFARHGKKLMGWDEIVYGGISPSATMMLWRNWAPFYEPAVTGALKNGNNIVMTPLGPYYFDYGDGTKYVNYDKNGNVVPEKGVYLQNFIPKEYVGTENEKQFVGVQGCLWSEYLPNYKRLQFMAFPRMIALAEAAWTAQADKDIVDFEARLKNHYPRLDERGVTYALPKLDGVAKNVVVTKDSPVTITLQPSRFEGAKTYYTLDGSKPTVNSTEYTAPFTLTEKTTVKIATFYNGMRSDVQVIEADSQQFINAEEVQGETLAPGIRRSYMKYKSGHNGEIAITKAPVASVENKIALFNLNDDAYKYDVTFTGYFVAPEDGIYDIQAKGRGTVTCKLSGKKINSKKSGLVALKKGAHPIKVTYKTGHRSGFGFSIAKDGKKLDLTKVLMYK